MSNFAKCPQRWLTQCHSGLPRLTDSASPQSAESVLGYEADQYGPNRPSWSPGFYQGSLPDGVTRYITNGAGVSAPSENLGFYFSGMRSPTWGPIYYEDSSANMTANTLIEVDMSTMRDEKWTNHTLPDNITPRANAGLVWIPVGEQGVLVAIGGVTAPEEIWPMGLNNSQSSDSEAQSPGLMTSIPVYDIASSTWYVQNTSGQAPGQLTEFCAVAATANDSSSFNIYIYGGYDGLNAADAPSDDVWVLSLPAFQWVKVYSGTPSHGRSGHQCMTPYPDQMFIVGGVHQNQATCVEGGIVQIFNLNKLEFQNTYDPDTWSHYKVPSVVRQAIGGSSKRDAQLDGALAAIFNKPYTKHIEHYYPYAKNASSSDTSGGSRHSGVGKGAIIGISVAAGVIGLLLLILVVLLVRRRSIIRSGSSEKSAHSSNSRVSRWLNGASCTTAVEKRPSPQQWQSTASSRPEVQQIGPYASLSDSSTPPLPAVQTVRHEMSDKTELQKAPFELATDYNDLDHPRHSGIVDTAYNVDYGHTHANSESISSNNPHSRSTSDETYANRPSPMSSSNNSNPNNGTSPLRHMRVPPTGPASDISSPSREADSTSAKYSSDTLPWPFPQTQNTWRAQSRQSRPATTTPRNPFEHPRDRDSENSSVQPIMEEQEPLEDLEAQHHSQHHRYGQNLTARELPTVKDRDRDPRFSYQHTNESSSSGVGSLPSPIHTHEGASMPQDEAGRRSLFETISPVTPTTTANNWYGHGNMR